MKRPPDAEVAQAVSMATLCKTYGTLPHAGGLMDQDAEMVLQLAYVAEAWAVRDERDAEQVNKRMKTSRPVRRR